MSATLRERRRQLLRDEIVLAAQQLLGERGFAALAMDELAQRVGISKPTLYAHFPTREDLVASMIGALVEQLFSETIRLQSPEASPLERLSMLLRRAMQVQIEAHAAIYQLWLPEVAEVLRKHPISRGSMEDAQRQVLILCQAAIDCGEVTISQNAGHVARLFSSLVCLPFAGGVPVSDRRDAEELIDLAVRLLMRQLRST